MGTWRVDPEEQAELNRRVAAEKAALANINPEGGYFHNLFGQAQDSLGSALSLFGVDRTISGQKVRPLGSVAYRNGEKVLWAGQDWDYQSPESFNELVDKGEIKIEEKYHGEIATDNVLKTLSNAAKTTSNFLEQHESGRNLKSNLSELAIGAGDVYDYLIDESNRGGQSTTGEWGAWALGSVLRDREKYSQVAADLLGQLKINGQSIDPRLLKAGSEEVIDTLLTLGIAPFAKGIGRGISTVIDNAVPPGAGSLVPVGVADDLMIKPPVTEFKPTSVFQVAGNMEAAGWQGPIKSMLNSKVPHEVIAARLAKPWHQGLKKGYEALSLEDLAKDKGGWLTRMIGRADDYAQGLRDWRVAKGKGMSSEGLARIQRKFYDDLSENPLDAFKQIYDPNNPIRKLLQKGFNSLAGKEWHHIFGNKDAAEFFLTAVAQDPYIAVNLFHYMKKLKLSTSGVPDNIALMKLKQHRGKGVGWHTRSKDWGLEGKGLKPGDASFPDWAHEVSKGILDGSTDVNEIFSFIELYSRLNKAQRELLKAEHGASIISEQGPIMQYIQGVGKKPPNQVLQ